MWIAGSEITAVVSADPLSPQHRGWDSPQSRIRHLPAPVGVARPLPVLVAPRLLRIFWAGFFLNLVTAASCLRRTRRPPLHSDVLHQAGAHRGWHGAVGADRTFFWTGHERRLRPEPVKGMARCRSSSG